MCAVMELASKVHGPEPLEIMRKAGLEGRIEKFQATQALRPHVHSLSATVEHSPTDAAPAPLTAASTIAPKSAAATATSTSEPSSCAKEQSNAEPLAAHPHPHPPPPQPPPQPPLSSALALRKHLHRRDWSLSPRQLSERSSTPNSTDGVELGASPTPLTEASLVSGSSATATPTPTPVSLSAPPADAPVDRSLSATPVPPDCSPSASPLSLGPPPAAGLSALPTHKAEARANGRAARSHRSALVPLLGAKEEANGCVRPLSAAPIRARLSPPTSATEELSAKEDLKIEVLSSNSSVR